VERHWARSLIRFNWAARCPAPESAGCECSLVLVLRRKVFFKVYAALKSFFLGLVMLIMQCHLLNLLCCLSLAALPSVTSKCRHPQVMTPRPGRTVLPPPAAPQDPPRKYLIMVGGTNRDKLLPDLLFPTRLIPFSPLE